MCGSSILAQVDCHRSASSFDRTWTSRLVHLKQNWCYLTVLDIRLSISNQIFPGDSFHWISSSTVNREWISLNRFNHFLELKAVTHQAKVLNVDHGTSGTVPNSDTQEKTNLRVNQIHKDQASVTNNQSPRKPERPNPRLAKILAEPHAGNTLAMNGRRLNEDDAHHIAYYLTQPNQARNHRKLRTLETKNYNTTRLVNSLIPLLWLLHLATHHRHSHADTHTTQPMEQSNRG